MTKFIPILAFICLVFSSCSRHYSDMRTYLKLEHREAFLKTEEERHDGKPEEMVHTLPHQNNPVFTQAPALPCLNNTTGNGLVVKNRFVVKRSFPVRFSPDYATPRDSSKTKHLHKKQIKRFLKQLSPNTKFNKYWYIFYGLFLIAPIVAGLVFHSFLIGFIIGLGLSLLCVASVVCIILSLSAIRDAKGSGKLPVAIIKLILSLALLALTVFLAVLLWHSILALVLLFVYDLILMAAVTFWFLLLSQGV